MLVPGVIIALIYSYGPMFGVIMAFQNYEPTTGFLHSPLVGLQNFKFLMALPDTRQVLFNTVFISSMKIVANFTAPIVLALMLNEVRNIFFKRITQTVVYLPHFLSWVILGGILVDILSAPNGMANQLIGLFGIKPISFLQSNNWFPYILVVTDVWKNVGFNTIIYLAALTNINPNLYEAASVDGANRWKQTWHITVPGILPIAVVVGTLSLQSVLEGGFDQVFNLYNPLVYPSGDIIDTFVYRLGLQNLQYSVATAVGLFKSVVSAILIVVSYWLARRFAGYSIF